MFRATVTGKRQITIPKEICEFLNIETGKLVVFKEEKGRIIFDIEKGHQECFACHGTNKIGDKGCFVCGGAGELEINVANNIFKLIGVIGMNIRKYHVSWEFIQQEFDRDTQNIIIKDYPTIKLASREYSNNELKRIQDEIQKIIIQQFTPRSVEDENLFCVPSDSELDAILDTLVTEKAKQEVNKWFRYDRTWMYK